MTLSGPCSVDSDGYSSGGSAGWTPSRLCLCRRKLLEVKEDNRRGEERRTELKRTEGTLVMWLSPVRLLLPCLVDQGETGCSWCQPWERKPPTVGPPCLPGQTVSLSSWSGRLVVRNGVCGKAVEASNSFMLSKAAVLRVSM